MRVISCLIITTCLCITTAYAAETQPLPFSDMEENTQYYEAIEYLYNEGIVSGYANNQFKPDREVNRVEALKILLLSANIEAETEEETGFTDIEGGEWYHKYLSEGLSRNIVAGYEDGSFRPENPVNLVEFLKMLVNTNQLIPSQPEEDDFYPDADKDAWYAGYLNYGKENGLIHTDCEGMINPSRNITRAELADIIYRYKNSNYYSGEISCGEASYYGDTFNGRNTASGEKFDQNKMTAAHKTLPFGTTVRVSNVENGKTVEVTINDRGPYGEGRVLDLSKSAFQMLGSLSRGILQVEYEVVYPETT